MSIEKQRDILGQAILAKSCGEQAKAIARIPIDPRLDGELLDIATYIESENYKGLVVDVIGIAGAGIATPLTVNSLMACATTTSQTEGWSKDQHDVLGATAVLMEKLAKLEAGKRILALTLLNFSFCSKCGGSFEQLGQHCGCE